MQWVKTISNGTESCINYFGWLSEFFPVECGIRQGLPFSPLGFILGVEILAHKIRQAPNITGIHLPFYRVEKIAKVALYADDNTLLLNNLCRVIVSKINVHSHTYSYVLVANWYHVREWSTLLAFMFRALARPLVACVKMATSSIVRCRQ